MQTAVMNDRNRESGVGNRESGVGSRESGIGKFLLRVIIRTSYKETFQTPLDQPSD